MKQTTGAPLEPPFSDRVGGRYHRICLLPRPLLALAHRLCVLASEIYLQYHRLLSETYNFLGRIKTPHDAAACLLEVGPEFGETEADSLFLRRCTDARIAGIRSMQAKRICATQIDAEIFLEGWQKGQEWAFEQRDNRASYSAIHGRGASWLPFYPKGYLALKNKLKS